MTMVGQNTPFFDDALLTAFLRTALGLAAAVTTYRVMLQREDYAVLVITLARSHRVVVKLAGPRAPLACPFDRTAAIVAMVRGGASVPIFEVLACDVTYRDWPWRYLVTTHLAGTTWARAARRGAGVPRHAHGDLGRAVARLHSIRFPSCGEIGADGRVQDGATLREALAQRAARRVADPRHVALFASVLRERAAIFDGAAGAVLSHEDLNPSNILLRRDDEGAWRLAALLDFDSAWAGSPESDLARLELWRGMAGEGFRAAYEEVLPIAPGYEERRPVYQLLWCLEYASSSPRHAADTAHVCAALGLPPISFS